MAGGPTRSSLPGPQSAHSTSNASSATRMRNDGRHLRVLANEDPRAPFDLQPRVKPSGQRFAAKSAMWCSQPQFIYLNIGVL